MGRGVMKKWAIALVAIFVLGCAVIIVLDALQRKPAPERTAFSAKEQGVQNLVPQLADEDRNKQVAAVPPAPDPVVTALVNKMKGGSNPFLRAVAQPVGVLQNLMVEGARPAVVAGQAAVDAPVAALILKMTGGNEELHRAW